MIFLPVFADAMSFYGDPIPWQCAPSVVDLQQDVHLVSVHGLWHPDSSLQRSVSPIFFFLPLVVTIIVCIVLLLLCGIRVRTTGLSLDERWTWDLSAAYATMA